uniref:Uncharacterized protein n=1 Tax=Glossina austeni TaxID=7395 RepID=A0A1A9VQ70_GLOAU
MEIHKLAIIHKLQPTSIPSKMFSLTAGIIEISGFKVIEFSSPRGSICYHSGCLCCVAIAHSTDSVLHADHADTQTYLCQSWNLLTNALLQVVTTIVDFSNNQ